VIEALHRQLLAACCVLLLAGCSSTPAAPDWQVAARAALDRAVAADLAGDTRAAAADYALAQRELARTGRADQVALAELTRCAVRVASVDFGPCSGFEPLRIDATAAERAYADFLAGKQSPAVADLLPPPHRALAAGNAAPDVTALKAIDDPLSRLVAIGVLFQQGRASRDVIALAVDTASGQGWRRPLLGWLGVELKLAEQAGDLAAAERLRRRIGIAGG
jgi:outer membrane murein-binding lipoprotein Lpp